MKPPAISTRVSRAVRFLPILVSLFAVPMAAWPQDILLKVEDAPADGLVVGRVDLTAAARWCRKTPVAPEGITAIDVAGGRHVPLQFVPDPDFDGHDRIAGTVVLRLDQPGAATLRLGFGAGKPAVAESAKPWSGVVSNSFYTVAHDPKHQGGLPWRITFNGTGKVFDQIRWNNRLHHRQQGSFCVCDDPAPQVERVVTGPLCTVVRVQGRYVQGGKPPASQPTAVYDWYYFADRPLVHVTATIRQRTPATWHEVHFLELNYPGPALPQWAGGEPPQEGRFQATMKSFSASQWGVIHDGTNGIGMFRGGQVLLHDGGGGTYIQPHGDVAWQEWNGASRAFSGWLWINAHASPAKAMSEVAKASNGQGRLTVAVDAVRARIEAVRRQLLSASKPRRQQSWWRVQGARQLEAQGRFEDALRVAEGKQPADWTIPQAGDLGLILERTGDGLRVISLFDAATDQSLMAAKPLPLFALTLRRDLTNEPVTLTANHGWREVSLSQERNAAGSFRLEWRKPADARLGNLRVVAIATPRPLTGALHWKLAVENPAPPWSVWRVVFPQVALADFGPRGEVFFPKAAGEVQRGVWQRSFRFTGTYPSGWTTMQFLAAYQPEQRTGLYLATHDPWGSTKDLLAESRPADHALVLSVNHPVPDMGVAGNRFELSGEAVWQVLRGDWFDAAVSYRDWVRKEARWYPKLSAAGREDTPRWMRELSVWALGSGPGNQCVPEVQAFTRYLGAPAAVHWYNWHQIPFDNDYPHYFPTTPGFAGGVRELQTSGTCVMPYINGRLWDTHDQGTNDFEFTRVALPAVTKNEKGEPYTETYGSKEKDGSPVRLGVMCPATALWQGRVREIVLRLMNECGVKGVYIDQIAAAQPTLCFDKSHGHPLGGGHWWTEGYWKMLREIRQSMPPDAMLTTECNGEPYVRYFDGYLTWHWQYDGQVPAFPAVYGGAIQMFGRSYGGGPTRDLALRMRAGQQLVFGEQLGWIAPGVVREKENAEFFRQLVQLRRQLVKYFHAGEMARPPKLTGDLPAVRADWQWGGVAWVTTDAVLTGAWHQPAAKRLALMFVNVSTNSVAAQVEYDTKPYGFSGGRLRVKVLTAEGGGESFTTPAVLRRNVVFPPRAAWAWEIGN